MRRFAAAISCMAIILCSCAAADDGSAAAARIKTSYGNAAGFEMSAVVSCGGDYRVEISCERDGGAAVSLADGGAPLEIRDVGERAALSCGDIGLEVEKTAVGGAAGAALGVPQAVRAALDGAWEKGDGEVKFSSGELTAVFDEKSAKLLSLSGGGYTVRTISFEFK